MGDSGRLAGKRVLVTGAKGYVGSEVARCALAEGAYVYGVDKVLDEFDEFKRRQVESPDRTRFVQADISSRLACESVLHDVRSWLGGLDVLVCAAAVMDPEDAGPTETPDDAWDRTFDVNVRSAWMMASAAIPVMTAQAESGGSIILIGSVVALRGSYITQVAYTASKGALSALGRELAVSLASSRIRVNCICPGPLEGGLLSSRMMDEDGRLIRVRQVPLGRLGCSNDVAAACTFLASDESSYITGIDLIVDGGASAGFLVAPS
jgi:NAD(P)-dependent dehydrogenase (short-subunit alcohol dehydrogenase family)